VIEKLSYRLEALRLSHTIGQQTRQAMEGRQREFMLREQLKAIQKEFGDADEAEPGLDDQKGKLEEAGLPEEIATQARRELRRLERMPEGATEAGMVRTYLEWLTELSWRIEAEPPIDIAAARRVLDEDHFDLDKIKRRIL
jgi:ATP-dependent Lon protease